MKGPFNGGGIASIPQAGLRQSGLLISLITRIRRGGIGCHRRRCWITTAMSFGLVLLLTGALPAQVKVTLDGVKDSLNVGEPMNVRLTISAPAGGRIQLPKWSEALDKFELLTSPDTSAFSQPSSGAPTIIQLRTTCYESGEQVFQPISVRWISTDGSRLDSAQTEPIIVFVQGVVPDTILALADTTQKPYKLLQPNRIRKLGVSLAEIAPWILLAAIAVGIFYLVRWWLRRRKRKTEVAAEIAAPPPRPAHVVALESLDHLRDEQLYQGGKIKEYYIRLSEIVRLYIEGRYQIPAMESTSFQLLRDTESALTDQNLRAVLANLLEDADLAKFAKQRPDEETCQRDLEKAYVFVRKTMPQPAPLLTQGEAA